ncbi:hypothetical protein WH47_01721 [Habropoda laboriosa]|uniref:Uncharacterized protein n=1 Tax=Habropoda laboriosa TaxID=597456 RepID=A0A0L7RJV3_9HYME|nr:hypothetical protein WH47_01721 [Habropoda laboriosa]
MYWKLTAENLLERCLDAYTRDNNENINSLIWTFAPKHSHCGKETVEIATFLAVSIFNEGFSAILRIMSEMEIFVGQQTNIFAELRDKEPMLQKQQD